MEGEQRGGSKRSFQLLTLSLPGRKMFSGSHAIFEGLSVAEGEGICGLQKASVA